MREHVQQDYTGLCKIITQMFLNLTEVMFHSSSFAYIQRWFGDDLASKMSKKWGCDTSQMKHKHISIINSERTDGLRQA